MKTSTLTGALLDYWVARSLGYSAELVNGVCVVTKEDRAYQYHPSSKWSHGGPVLESRIIHTAAIWARDDERGDYCTGRWQGIRRMPDHQVLIVEGDTLLEAAMRCQVASVYGQDVEDIQE